MHLNYMQIFICIIIHAATTSNNNKNLHEIIIVLFARCVLDATVIECSLLVRGEGCFGALELTWMAVGAWKAEKSIGTSAFRD